MRALHNLREVCLETKERADKLLNMLINKFIGANDAALGVLVIIHNR